VTLQTSAFTLYDAAGVKEDVQDVIFNANKGETNFLSRLKRTKATQKNHSWQTDNFPAAVTTNYQYEGDAWALAAITATTLLTNTSQIMYKVFGVSESEEQADKYGRGSEIAYQTLKYGKALARDMESTLLMNQAKAAGATGTVRKMASVLSWIYSNDSLSGTSPTGDGTDARSDGTQRAFTEALLQGALQLIWTATGSMEETDIFVGGFNKRVASGFTGVATKTKDADDKRIVATADIYESDFGLMNIVPNRLMRTRDAPILNMGYWRLADFRPMKTKTVLDGVFDGQARAIIWEGTLQADNELASGGVFDLTTS
jgi:hypothetical protein